MRMRSIDIAKGIAIVSIIVGHLRFTLGDSYRPLSIFVFLYHVPVFFIVSGYFLSDKTRLSSFIASKARRLLVPYYVTCVVLAVLLIAVFSFDTPPYSTSYGSFHNFIFACFYAAGSSSAQIPYERSIGAIWFLWALFLGLIEVRLLMRHRIAAPLVIAILYVIAVISSNTIWLPFSMQPAAIGALYIYIGVLLKKACFFDSPFRLDLFLALTLIVMLGFTYRLDVYVASAQMGGPINLAVSIAASCWIFQISDVVSRRTNPIGNFFEFFGNHSLTALCVHMLFLGVGFRQALIDIGVPQDYNIVFFLNLTIQLLSISCVIWLSKKANK